MIDNAKVNEVLSAARELFAQGRVTLFQKVLERGPVINGIQGGVTRFQYIAEGI